MSQTYGDLGATYGANINELYGTLFNTTEPPTVAGHPEIRAVITTQSVNATISTYGITAKIG